MPQTAIDLEHLARQTGGDLDLEREILALFAQQCVRHLRTIHQAEDARARMDAAHGIDPAVTAFFEDSQRNLEPAASLGMTTVLVGQYAAQSTAPFVHHRTHKLAPFLNAARLKEAA